MVTLNPETVDALNMLLEDVRASVEIEVALSNGATLYMEREALTSMGVEDTLLSFLLRDWLESRDLPVTRRINGIVLQALELTRYDDRMELFAQHQKASREGAERLLEEEGIDADGQAILRSIIDAHIRHTAWAEQHAQEFAETRQIDFRRPLGRPFDHASDPERAINGHLDAAGESNSPRISASAMSEPGMEDREDIEDVDDREDREDVMNEPEIPPTK